MKNKHADFPYAIRSFLGYLEGTEKAAHTIKNYRLDLLSFQNFLSQAGDKKAIPLSKLGPNDLEHYHDWLRGQGLKNNTRRRKLLTIQRFLHYLDRRHKIPEGIARKFPTPHKVERIPQTVPTDDLIAAIRKLPSETLLDARNQALLWTLAETGCLVSEVTRVRTSDWVREKIGAKLRIAGKNARELHVSRDLFEAIERLQNLATKGKGKTDAPLFQGFNRFGSMGAAITSRGVELLVRHAAPSLGFPELTPRTFRHSVVKKWFSEEVPQEEIQKRLGLRTAYAFRVYAAMLRTG